MKKIKRVKKSRRPNPYFKMTMIVSIIGALAYFAISRLPKATPIGINEVGISPSTVTLSLPDSIQTQINTDSTADLMINTGGSNVTAVQVELKYDPASISTPTLTQGDFLTEKIGNPKIKDGVISFVYVAPLESKGKSGEGKLATLKFKTLKSGSQITFTKNTMVAAVGSSVNVLKSATGANITTNSDNASSNPPALTDIVVVPTPPPNTTTNNTTNKQPVNQGSSDTTARRPDTTSERVFDETGNFGTTSGNSVNLLENDTEEDDISSQTAFARFLAWIKLIFGGNNAQN